MEGQIHFFREVHYGPETGFHKCSILSFLTTQTLFATTLHVGADSEYTNVGDAARDAGPGDTIFIHSGRYSGDQWIEDLAGTAESWIHVVGEEFGSVEFAGGVGAWVLSDPAYLHIENIVFTDQTHNGINLHDGDSYETPAHHIRFDRSKGRKKISSWHQGQRSLFGRY